MSDTENENMNEFAKLIHDVNDVNFLRALLNYMNGGEVPSDDSSDMKAHIIMIVKGKLDNKHIHDIILERKEQLAPSSSQSGGRRRTHRRKSHRKSHRKSRKSRRCRRS